MEVKTSEQLRGRGARQGGVSLLLLTAKIGLQTKWSSSTKVGKEVIQVGMPTCTNRYSNRKLNLWAFRAANRQGPLLNGELFTTTPMAMDIHKSRGVSIWWQSSLEKKWSIWWKSVISQSLMDSIHFLGSLRGPQEVPSRSNGSILAQETRDLVLLVSTQNWSSLRV